MKIFATTEKKESLSESVSRLVKSRNERLSIFNTVKDGLVKDNEEIDKVSTEIQSQMDLLSQSLEQVTEVTEQNNKTIDEINKIIG